MSVVIRCDRCFLYEDAEGVDRKGGFLLPSGWEYLETDNEHICTECVWLESRVEE